MYIDEKLTASDPTSKWISDFVHSDNPKFAGKSKKERIRMALGASYAAKGKSRNEETKLDEVSMGLLTRYKEKAGQQASAMNKAVGDVATSSAAPEHKKAAIDTLVQKGNKRFSGIVRATNKQFAKTTKEEVEQIEELSSDTLNKYKAKATAVARSNQAVARYGDPDDIDARTKAGETYDKRMKGIKAANTRLNKEEVEGLDEISKKTLGSYVSKASVDMANRTADGVQKRALAGADYAHNISRGMSVKQADANLKKDYDAAKPDTKKAVKRMHGIDRAVSRLTKEEVEELDELSKSTLASYAKKAVDSGDIASRIASRSASLSGKESKPMQDIVSKRGEGIKKAINRLAKEEVEELDELSKSTLASYAKKATHDARMKMATGKDFERVGANTRKPEYKAGAKKWEDKYKSDARRREAGTMKAIDRLAKEEVELDEMDKSQPSSSRGAEGLPVGKKAEPAKTDKVKSDALKALQKAYKKEETELDEATPTAQQVKQAIGIARDKRYAQGNVTGAVKAMNKINKGLAQHPSVQKELQKQNEDIESVDEVTKATGGLKKACWKGYTAVGLKKKGGRMVPNCVPIKDETELKTFKQLKEELNGNS